MKKRNGRASSLEAELKQLELKIKKANRLAAKGIEENVSLFHAMASEAEKDLKRLKGVGKTSLRAFRNELKRSWKDLKRIAYQQF